MPVAEKNTQPKGQAYGQATQQRAYVQQTGGQPEQPDFDALGADEPDEGFEVPEFGSAADAMLAPTQRPDESVLSPYRPQPQFDLASGPNLDMLRLVRDPSISSEMRQMLKLAMISRALGPGAVELD